MHKPEEELQGCYWLILPVNLLKRSMELIQSTLRQENKRLDEAMLEAGRLGAELSTLFTLDEISAGA